MDDLPLGEFMTADEVARSAGVTKRRVCQVCQRGQLAAVMKGGIWLVPRKDALAWVYSERRPGRPPRKGRKR